MGLSCRDYITGAASQGDYHKIADEVWTINALGGAILCDRVIAMDPLPLLVELVPSWAWMKTTPVPIYTCFKHADFPSSVDYPLEAVINATGQSYLSTSVAYAFALAIAAGAKKILAYGCDFSYPDRHEAESGRACVEFWVGIALARGIEISVAHNSTLMDMMVPEAERLYGYREAGLKGVITKDGDRLRVKLVPLDTPPATPPKISNPAPPPLEVARPSPRRPAGPGYPMSRHNGAAHPEAKP